MKLLTFHGPGRYFVVPGHFTLEAGGSRSVDDELADTLVRANQRVNLTIKAAKPRKNARKRLASQPEARQGEGQPIATDQKE
jgi:hypothetical protein